MKEKCFVKKLNNVLPKDALLTIYKSFVTPLGLWGYCVSLT